jgi:hypothetical protein
VSKVIVKGNIKEEGSIDHIKGCFLEGLDYNVLVMVLEDEVLK